ncbi:MAG: helicase-related protein [bacterium]
MAGKLPTIIDNQGEVTLRDAVAQIAASTKELDIATGFFELGALLSLDGEWQRIGNVRILLGDPASRKTRRELVEAFRRGNEDAIEQCKERDDTLTGIEAVRQALDTRKIAVRVYTRERFHAKSYIFHTEPPNPVDFAVVGSSNFTRPGLVKNVELNLLTTDQVHIEKLSEWFAGMWNDAEQRLLNEEALEIIARHTREYTPFEVYAKALYEFFAGRQKSSDDWERTESAVYPRLSKYQQDGYHTALRMAENWGGALVCDGVGLGKTYIGLMLLERLIHDKNRVLLIVPKSAEDSVWLRHIRPSTANPDPILKHLHRSVFGQLFRVKRHTDFGRPGTIPEAELQELERDTDAIIVDEAHHFRTPSAYRSKMLKRLAKGKRVFLLTATPINNRLLDLYELISCFAPEKDHFRSIAIQDYRRLFSRPDRQFEEAIRLGDWRDLAEVDKFLSEQQLFRQILIQRSRRYVKESEQGRANAPIFPVRQRPRVIRYSLRKVYATIYDEIKQAFDREAPFLNLALYCTEAYRKGEPAEKKLLEQKQVVGLIRTLLLKRLESSYKAFEASVEDLLAKMAEFVRAYDPDKYEGWVKANGRYWSRIKDHQHARLELSDTEAEEEDQEENLLPESLQIATAEYHMDRLLGDVIDDMNVLLEFLAKIAKRFYTTDDREDPARDDKLQKLLLLLTSPPDKGEPDIRGRKVVIFSEFRDTARYLLRQLRDAGLKDVEEMDSTRKMNREEVIKRFAPHYNCEPGQVSEYLDKPINILVSTDVLSEGLNLQDASLMVNYDLHWNPVRLMQRIGRVDRRMDEAIERRLKRPRQLAGKVFFWNFLPPKELEEILGLFRRVTGKVLRINAALGIEGALLTPDDPEMTLKEFNEAYEGRESVEEQMRRELERVERELPELYAELADLPRRVFSGRVRASRVPLKPGVFAAYRVWSDPDARTSDVHWYYRERGSGAITEGLEEIWKTVRCEQAEPRVVKLGPKGLSPEHEAIETHRVRKLMRDRGLPLSVKPVLACWLEIA